jgi:hypothetical protein
MLRLSALNLSCLGKSARVFDRPSTENEDKKPSCEENKPAEAGNQAELDLICDMFGGFHYQL